MKATINGVIVEGTPEEMEKFFGLMTLDEELMNESKGRKKSNGATKTGLQVEKAWIREGESIIPITPFDSRGTWKG